jgi:hypothetical protein
MWEVSREASTAGGSGDAGDLGGEAVFVGGSPGVGDVLLCNCLGDAGVHCSSLSIESCSATAKRMN